MQSIIQELGMNREKYKWQLVEGIKARLSDSSYGRQRAIFDSGQLAVG
jgi:hypothetical protein